MRECSVELDLVQEKKDGDIWVRMSNAEADTLFRDIARRYGLTAKLLKRVGPGGGNPLWRFSGPAANVRQLVTKWYSPGDREMAEEQLALASDVPGRRLDAIRKRDKGEW